MIRLWKTYGPLLLIPLALGAGIVSLLQLERTWAGPEVETPIPALEKPVEKQHLWIVLIDSLPDRLLGTGRLPFTDGLAAQGVSGSLKPCTDALTGPCLKAAFTGRDRFSVFALFEDFVFTEQTSSGSIFEALHRTGYRIGVVATYSWKQFQHAFSSKIFYGLAIHEDYTDHVAVRESVDMLHRDDPDVMITALRYFDNVTHKYKPGSKEYFAEALVSDACVRDIHEAMPPSWNLLVFGDHGHDDVDGRHVAGLDIPAGYLFYGPAFREGVKKDIDIRSIHYVLSALFDVPVQGGPPDKDLRSMFRADWLSLHAARSAPEEILRSASDDEGPGTHRPWFVEILFAMAFAILGMAACSLGTGTWSFGRAVLPVLTLLGLVAIEGSLYTWLRPRTVQISFLWDYAVIAMEVASAYVAAVLILPGRTLQARGMLTSMIYLLFTLILHFPTVYNFGSSRYIVHGALVAAVILLATTLRSRGENKRHAGRAALLAGAAGILLLMNIDMNVHDFQFHYFYWSKALFQIVHPALVFGAASGLLFYILSDGRQRGIAAFVLLQAFAVPSGILPAWTFALPVAIAFWMIFPDFMKLRSMRRIRVEWFVSLALIAIFYFLDRSFNETTEMTVFFLIAVLLFKAMGMVLKSMKGKNDAWLVHALSAVLAFALGLFSLWITSHMSMAGVRYQPVLNWFSAKAIARIWTLIALIVFFFYALPFAVFSALLKTYLPDGYRTLVRWWVPLAAVKLMCLTLFIRVMTMANAGQAIIRDTINTLLAWVLVALFGLLFYAAGLSGAPAAKGARPSKRGDPQASRGS